MSRKYRVGILGATGTVGQRFIQLLEGHPQFEVAALAASDRSKGKAYSEACAWRLPGDMPEAVRGMKVEAPEPPLDCDIVFSSLPGDIARETEESFARAGYAVISNSSALRMDEDVPLLIPEVNHEHLAQLDAQKASRGLDRGMIVTNPNCSTIMPSLDAVDNVIPYIGGEEEKIEAETLKILGRFEGGGIRHAPFKVSAQVHRVNVSDGHMAAVRVKLARQATVEELRDAFSSFTSLPQELRLHTAPERPIVVRDEADRPQPRLDRDAGRGMSVTVGRIFPDKVLDYRFVALSHNTVRGAAGAAILNAELLVATGRL